MVPLHLLLQGPVIEQLPAGLVTSFPIWMLDPDTSKLSRVPDQADGSQSWVEPRSCAALWVPEGSTVPTATVGVAMLVKDGRPRYLFPHLDTVDGRPRYLFPHLDPRPSLDGRPRYLFPHLDTVVARGGRAWRNRGVASVALAHSWQQFAHVPVQDLSLSAYVGAPVPQEEGDGEGGQGGGEGEGGAKTDAWHAVAEGVEVEAAVLQLMGVIADPPAELNDGISILVAPVKGAAPFPLPPDGSKIRVFLSDYPAPVRLLEVETTRGAQLEVRVERVASAAKSEYLPDIYRPLYC
ncbi:hypothetical protein JKP88DRAFT_301458 [Tribonema minus]|uniref:Uncharacterized protein n=1 Tax=Tribonema minus TaxID=303371 RepID=A0A836CL77_9STRA|nr:hypothetical protein JKP88DRAFT_301458 [Tribonema minus]